MAGNLDQILESTTPERLATGFEFTEGPLWHRDGFWLFGDLPNNRIHRLTPVVSQKSSEETPAGPTEQLSTSRAG